MNRGFGFGLVNHYMCHFSPKDPKVRVPQSWATSQRQSGGVAHV